MSVNGCFSQIIGFSRSEDICVDDWDASYALSDSGLYIDELQGMSLRILDAVGGKDSIWSMMDRARTNGINTFKTDIFTELLKYNEYRREKFTGEIGHRRFTSVITKHIYHGMRFYSNIRGGVFTLRGVTLNLNSTENVNLLIYDDFTLLHTIAISSTAGQPKYNAITPIDLELNGNYYFIYAPIGTPYNNKMTCGCGGYRWCFNVEKPCYNSSKENWTLWAMAGGISGDAITPDSDDIIGLEDWSVSQYAQGLRLHGDFKCDAMNMLCSDSSDFDNNEIDKAIAYAILYKTAEFLTYEIKNSGEVSRYTLIGNDDVLGTNMQYYSDRYAVMINFIAQNIEPSRNECLKCRSVLGIGKTSHFI
jgi:hypothetical protein